MIKIYFDIAESNGAAISFVGAEDTEIILAGTTINSMSTSEKNAEYLKYADDYDIQFIFDDCVPQLEFYTVPFVDIIAKDSDGGFIGSLGQQFDLEGDSPICYINKDLKCFIISDDTINFLKNLGSWKHILIPFDKITLYSSKVDAQKNLEFVDFSNLCMG